MWGIFCKTDFWMFWNPTGLKNSSFHVIRVWKSATQVQITKKISKVWVNTTIANDYGRSSDGIPWMAEDN